MKYFPVSLNVTARQVTVVGGGHIAEQRVQTLLECDARVTVISPEVTEVIESLSNAGKIRVSLRRYEPGDLGNAWMVLAATDDPEANDAAWHEARDRKIPINVADDPEKCDFIMPAVVRRDDLTIAISTGGGSPALAARLRRRLASIVGPEYGRLLEVLTRVRARLKESVSDPEERLQLQYRIVDSTMPDRTIAFDNETIESKIEKIFQDAAKGTSQVSGCVYIVGAGPGDPGLITSRGLESIRMAEVILHDRLIDRRLLEEARPGTEIIDVGKRVGDRRQMQDFIQETMVERAKQGQTVCRLKGGDPFVFGRGGEEARALTEANIPFEIVPGVTSAIAAPAAAGIPLTHRDVAHSFMVMTGSRADDAGPGEWAGARSIIAGGGTVVVLMGLSRLSVIVRRLRDAGCGHETPAAVISRGTWMEQDVRVGTLASIESLSDGIESPAVIVFGVTVGERAHLARLRAER